MKRSRAVSAAAVASFALLLAARPASAGTATNTLSVNATVLGVCTIDPATLAFGNYDSTANVDVSTSLTVRCTSGSSYWVGLGAGGNASGATRRMTDGTSFLTYELYRDAGRTQVWDNADPAPAIPHASAGNPGVGLSAYTTTVYGRIPAAQLVPVGVYADAVVMTVNF